MNNHPTYKDFTQRRVELGLDNFTIRQKCEKCCARGLTLVEGATNFKCTSCGATKKLGFWFAQFIKAKPVMTFGEASKLIGANPTGSTLRRANIEHRLETIGRLARKNGEPSKKEHLVSRDGLLKFYLIHYNRRPKGKKATTTNGSTATE